MHLPLLNAKFRSVALVFLLVAQGFTTGCDGLMGFGPRTSGSPAATSTQDAGATPPSPDGLAAYGAKCQACHGAYTALSTPAGLKTGNLAGAAAAVIRSSCQSLPVLTESDMNLIVAVLAKVQRSKLVSKGVNARTLNLPIVPPQASPPAPVPASASIAPAPAPAK